MSRKIVKFCIGVSLICLFLTGCSGVGIGGNPDLLKEDVTENTTTKKKKKAEPCFDIDRITLMDAIKTGKIQVEDDEEYGDNPECIKSCKAKSGLFHMDIFDYKEKYKEKNDGTYMVQIIFYVDKLKTKEGKAEALQLLQEVCEQLNIAYEEDILWGYVEEILAEQVKNMKFREKDYQENAHIVVTKQYQDEEVQFRITPRKMLEE